MSLIKLWHKKNGSHQTKKYLLPLFTAVCVAALFFTSCANSAGSIDSSDGKKEKFTITIKTQNITSTKEAEGRSIFPVLSGSENYTLSYKSGESEDWQNLDGTFPEYQMFIIPKTYTLKLDAYSDAEKKNLILTGQNSLTITSGMENAEVPFIMQPPENATGTGSVSLVLSADTDTQIATFEIKADSEVLSLVWTKDDTETTYTKGTITAASVPNGTYHLTISGKTTAGETIYVRSETLTVWSGLESSAWIFADGSSSDELKITASDLYSTFYVKGSTGPYNFYTSDGIGDVTASDTNSGNITSPLSTISTAIAKCTVANKPYTINIDGTFETNTTIDILEDMNITINALGTPQNTDTTDTRPVIKFNISGDSGIMALDNTVFSMNNIVMDGLQNDGGVCGVFSSGNELNLSGCTVKDFKEGGICAGGKVSLLNCSIIDNESSSTGTGINFSGTSLKITGCKIQGNNKNTTDTNQNGGGIYIDSADAVVTISDSTINENNAQTGAGIYLNSGTLTISSTTMESNTATGDAGALCINNGSVTLTDCTISSNEAQNGGGIYIASDVTATLTGCTISENSAKSTGGGLKIYSPAKLTNCKILKNSSGWDGGGFGCEVSASDSATINVTFTECKIIENTSGNNGGGGAILSNVNATFKSCKIDGNTTKFNGGGLLLYGTPTATLEDCTISGNTGNSGGAIRTDGGGLTLTLTGTQSGGGTIISGNTSSTSDAGKSIYLSSGYMNISGYIQITSDNPARLRTGRTTITGTLNGTTPVITVTPEEYKEGIVIVSAGSGVTLADEAGKFKISNPDYIISKEGKLCYLGTTSTTAADNIAVFTNIPAGCEATVNLDNLGQTTWSNHSSIEINGKVTVKATNPTTIDSKSSCIFTVKKGGTLTLESNVTLYTTVDNPVSCVKVEEGGTLILDGAKITSSSTTNPTGVSITNGTLIMNSGTISGIKGSAILATNSNITIKGGTISNNSGSRATVSLTNCTADIQNLTIINNSANCNGGGIRISGGGTYTFTSCKISNNSTGYSNGEPGYGGGIYINTGTVTLKDCTITGNSAINSGRSSKGGGIYLAEGTLTTTNCTISGNTTKDVSTETSGYGSQIYAVAGSVYNGTELTEDKVID